MLLEWILFQIFINTVEIVALFYLLCSKFTAKRKSFIPILFFIAWLTIFISLPIFISFRGLPLTEVVTFLTCLTYLILFRSGSILKKIFWVTIAEVLIMAIAFFSITIIAFIHGVGHIDIITMTSTERLLTMIIAKILQIFTFYILAKKKREYKTGNSLSAIPILICLTIPLMSFVITIFLYISILEGLDIRENITFLISVGFLIINIIVFVLYEFINREAEKNYILIAKQKQYELTEEHNCQIIEIYDKMREWRHDYANQMQLIVSMLEKAEPDAHISETINYIRSLDDKITSTSLDIVTGNYIVDAIISAKATLASAHDVHFEYNIILPNEISIDDTDLCSVLSNLLDNAIEACCKLDSGRYIIFEMITFRTQLIIKVVNSSDGKYKVENDKFKTTKRGDLHGIGIGHIKSIVESHNGIIDIKPEALCFTTHISIPLGQKSAN